MRTVEEEPGLGMRTDNHVRGNLMSSSTTGMRHVYA